jgi:hypothetical protein
MDFDELASKLEALGNRPPQADPNDSSRIRLLEAAKKMIPALETPSEATQRLMYTVGATDLESPELTIGAFRNHGRQGWI